MGSSSSSADVPSRSSLHVNQGWRGQAFSSGRGLREIHGLAAQDRAAHAKPGFPSARSHLVGVRGFVAESEALQLLAKGLSVNIQDLGGLRLVAPHGGEDLANVRGLDLRKRAVGGFE